MTTTCGHRDYVASRAVTGTIPRVRGQRRRRSPSRAASQPILGGSLVGRPGVYVPRRAAGTYIASPRRSKTGSNVPELTNTRAHISVVSGSAPWNLLSTTCAFAWPWVLLTGTSMRRDRQPLPRSDTGDDGASSPSYNVVRCTQLNPEPINRRQQVSPRIPWSPDVSKRESLSFAL